MQIEHWQLLKINLPDVFNDEQFATWLNDPTRVQATWHKKGDALNEYSDLFFTFDSGEGSDSDMPEHIWERICDIVVHELGEFANCVVWLTNLQ